MDHTRNNDRFEVISVNGKLWSLDTMSSVFISTYILKEKETKNFYWSGSDIFDLFGRESIRMFFSFNEGTYLIDIHQFESWEDDLYLAPMVESEHTETDLKTLTEVI